MPLCFFKHLLTYGALLRFSAGCLGSGRMRRCFSCKSAVGADLRAFMLVEVESLATKTLGSYVTANRTSIVTVGVVAVVMHAINH